jgi:putative ABC transport system permease protein
LVIAVAICSGSVFTGAVFLRSVDSSVETGFSRLGADLLIVPDGTLTNITAALLTAEPTDLTLEADIVGRLASLKGVGRVAPQLVFRTDASGYGASRELVDLVAFDPGRDLTVQPWLDERLNRPLRKGDVILGGRRAETLGSELLLFGRPFTVYGRLAKTAVGTHERGLFITFETLEDSKGAIRQICGAKATLESNKLSGVLVELMPGATGQQVRFAVLANVPGVKVVSGTSMLSSIRQGLGALLNSVFAIMTVMFASTVTMVSVMFSAIITERRRELGLLMAIGARRRQILALLLMEASIATAAGGVLGCLFCLALLRLFRHSLSYYLDGMGIPLLWLSEGAISLIAIACIAVSTVIGAAGALYPAWQASRREPYDLIREG